MKTDKCQSNLILHHISHLKANAQLLKENGFDVSFLAPSSFLSSSKRLLKGRRDSLRQCLSLSQGDLFIA